MSKCAVPTGLCLTCMFRAVSSFTTSSGLKYTSVLRPLRPLMLTISTVANTSTRSPLRMDKVCLGTKLPPSITPVLTRWSTTQSCAILAAWPLVSSYLPSVMERVFSPGRTCVFVSNLRYCLATIIPS